MLVEQGTLDAAHAQFLADYKAAGVGVRQIEKVPLKTAVFDARKGLIALLDPFVTKPAWTSVVFDNRNGGGDERPVDGLLAARGRWRG